MTKTNTFKEHLHRAILVTCDIWDTDFISDNWGPEFLTTCVTWQLRVTLDRIRNSCDVFLILSGSFVFFFFLFGLYKCLSGCSRLFQIFPIFSGFLRFSARLDIKSSDFTGPEYLSIAYYEGLACSIFSGSVKIRFLGRTLAWWLQDYLGHCVQSTLNWGGRDKWSPTSATSILTSSCYMGGGENVLCTMTQGAWCWPHAWIMCRIGHPVLHYDMHYAWLF